MVHVEGLTDYFRQRVAPERSYATLELRRWVVENAVWTEAQPDGRVRYWAIVPELDGRAVRVVMDGTFAHNCFMDRGFKLHRRGRSR